MGVWGTDSRSLIIGLLLGLVMALVLGLGLARRHHRAQLRAIEVELADYPREAEGAADYAHQFELQAAVEEYLEAKVERVMDEVIGPDRVSATVHVALSLTRQETEVESVMPSSATVLAEETSERASAELGSEELALRHYAVDRTVREIVGADAVVERLNIVLVFSSLDEDEITRSFSPKTINMAKLAVGFDEARGDQIAYASELEAIARAQTEEIQKRYNGASARSSGPI